MCRNFFDFFGEDIVLWAKRLRRDLPLTLTVYEDIGRHGLPSKVIDDPSVIAQAVRAFAALSVCGCVGEYEGATATSYVFSSSDGQQYGFTFSQGFLLFRHRLYAVRTQPGLLK